MQTQTRGPWADFRWIVRDVIGLKWLLLVCLWVLIVYLVLYEGCFILYYIILSYIIFDSRSEASGDNATTTTTTTTTTNDDNDDNDNDNHDNNDHDNDNEHNNNNSNNVTRAGHGSAASCGVRRRVGASRNLPRSLGTSPRLGLLGRLRKGLPSIVRDVLL